MPAGDLNFKQFCVHTYLEHIGALYFRLNQLEKNIAAMRARVEDINQALDTTQQYFSYDNPILTDGIMKLIEAEHTWAVEVNDSFEKIEEARDICLGFDLAGLALWERIVMRKSWNDLSDDLGYTRRHLQRLTADIVSKIFNCLPVWARKYTYSKYRACC